MTLQSCYEMLGGSYAEAKTRLMSDRLVEKFILKFPQDDSEPALRAAVAAGDIEGSFRAAHTLKGVAGNLSFTALQKAASDLTEQLRPLAGPADPALFAEVERYYALALDTLARYAAEK